MTQNTPCEQCNKLTTGRCPEHINTPIIKIGICPIEDGTCPGIKEESKCPYNAGAHIIRAKKSNE